MKKVIYSVEKKARLIINDLDLYEVQTATKCSESDHYFWKSVGSHKNTANGLQNAIIQYYMTIVYKMNKKIFKESKELK